MKYICGMLMTKGSLYFIGEKIHEWIIYMVMAVVPLVFTENIGVYDLSFKWVKSMFLLQSVCASCGVQHSPVYNILEVFEKSQTIAQIKIHQFKVWIIVQSV